MSQPLILIADQTLAIQAQLGDLLSGDASVISVIQHEQLDYWLQTPGQIPDLLLIDRDFALGIDADLSAFCQRWQSHPQMRHCDILITGHADDQAEALALMAGAQDYIRKPLHPLLAMARVRRQLSVRQERERLEALSTTDGLTGIANRRYLDEFLSAEWRRAQREGGNIGLIMVDIDFFKLFNDHYGHIEGDACLKQVAALLKASAQRPRDLVARYGGEEFAVVLPSIHFEGLSVVAERLQQAINKADIQHLASPLNQRVTLSMGLAWSEPCADDNWQTLLAAADEALYAAKNAGRNQYSQTVDLASARVLV